MSTSVAVLGSGVVLTPLLGEASWQAWLAAAHSQAQNDESRIKKAQWLSMAGVLAAAGLWSNLAPYDVAIGFALTACAMSVMFQSLQSRHYPVAVVFGALAVLYNPVSPVFRF